MQNNVSCRNIDSIALQHFTTKGTRNVLLQEQSVYQGCSRGRMGGLWIMFIFKTVMKSIVFNLLNVYCRYIKLLVLLVKLTIFTYYFFITVMPDRSIIEWCDICQLKHTHMFFFFSIQTLVWVCHIITTTGCTHSHVIYFMSNMNMNLWGCMVKANVGNDTIRLLWCLYIPLKKYLQAFIICPCLSTFFNTHCCSVSPCYLMSEVDHLAVFLSHLTQNMPIWPPHRYFLL